MDFFLSAEGCAPGTTFWSPLEREFTKKLELLKDSYYGDELTKIYIISIILPPEYFTDGGFKERKIFFRKTHDADIRLRIDYHSFVYAKPDKRREIYKQHIIDSIMTLQRKVSKTYLFDQLVSDVAAVLDS